jgi:hypothetical protein
MFWKLIQKKKKKKQFEFRVMMELDGIVNY